jgi:predicted methyltransferase
VPCFITELKNKNPDLLEAEISGMLAIIKNSSQTRVEELVAVTGLPKETITKFLKSLPQDTTAMLTQLNQEIVPHKWSIFDYSQNETQELEQKFTELLKTVSVKAKRDYDQFFATAHTSISKALILRDKGLLTGKRIALLGDDDFVAVALCLAGSPKSITVFDIDTELLTAIKAITSSMGKDIVQTVQTDLRSNKKNQFSPAFSDYDIVITDPPYTPSGVTLFLNRALQVLGPQKDFAGKYIFLYYGNSYKSPEKYLKIQEIINRFNLQIEDRTNKFARYTGADSIGNASSLYILKTTPFTKTVAEEELSLPIYTHETQKIEKFPYVSHFVIKVYGVPEKLILSKTALLKALGRLCQTHKFKVVDQKLTEFKRHGLSITFILANSNLLVHTWPEYHALHIDLVTCSPIFAKEKLAQNCLSLFQATNLEIREIE